MRTPEDAVRSLKRYVAESLGEKWEVRLSREEGAFRRPFARVGSAGPALFPPGSQWVADVIQPMFVHAYPERGASSADGVIEAASAEDLLFTAFRVGVAEGRPMRVPLYDYAGVALTEGSTDRGYADFMRVSDLSIARAVDADDDALWVVVADVRLRWARTARTVEGRIAKGVGVAEFTSG